jgi:hypothetical protein
VFNWASATPVRDTALTLFRKSSSNRGREFLDLLVSHTFAFSFADVPLLDCAHFFAYPLMLSRYKKWVCTRVAILTRADTGVSFHGYFPSLGSFGMLSNKFRKVEFDFSKFLPYSLRGCARVPCSSTVRQYYTLLLSSLTLFYSEILCCQDV